MRHCFYSLFVIVGCACLVSGCATTVTAPSSTQTSVAPAKTESFPSQINVFVSKDQRVHLNGRKVSSKDLVRKLQKLGVNKDASIQLGADPESPFNAVVGVLRVLKNSGYSNVSMRVAPPEKTKP